MQTAKNRLIGNKTLFPVLIACLLVSGSLTSPVLAKTILGQTGSVNVIVDGLPVPSGTTLLSPSVLETGSQPARVFLAQGQILGLEKETRAYLETTPRGDVEVVVEDGAVAAQNAAGDPVTALANQRLVFVQAAQDQGGSSGGSGAATPVLATGGGGGCSVNSEGGCSGDGCAGTCECVKKDPATGGCEECSCVPPVPPSSGGLSTKAKIGIGAAVAVGLVVLIDELDDDDEPPTSPVN